MIKPNSNTAQVESFNNLSGYNDKMDFLAAIHADLFGAPEAVIVDEEKSAPDNGKYQDRVYGMGTI